MNTRTVPVEIPVELIERLRYWADRYEAFWPRTNEEPNGITDTMRQAATALAATPPQSEPLRCNLTGMKGCAYPVNAAPEQVGLDTTCKSDAQPESLRPEPAPAAAPDSDLLRGELGSIIVAATQGDPVPQPHTGTETIGCNSPNASAAAPICGVMCNSEADRLLLSRGGIACGLPEGHMGRHSWEYSFQDLRAIELDQRVANEQARSRTLVNAAVFATERAENAEKQLAEKDRGYAILHGQFVEMRNRWKIAFDLKEKAEAKLAELRKKERT